MVTHIMGTLIKMNRIQQNMSQRALCEGICVPSYLSKIESGEIIATSELINLLFDVLGIRYNDSVEFIEAGDKLLTQVYSQMNANQKLLYNLYKAIDLLQLTEDYEVAKEYFRKSVQIGLKTHETYFQSYVYHKMAWCHLCTGEIEQAMECIKKDQFPKGLMMKLEPEEVQAIIAYEKDDEKMSYHLIEKVSKEAHLKDKPIFKFLKACVEESYDLQKVDVAPYLLEIIEENHKKVDILPYFKRLLVKYYKENRKYKEAVMLLEKK